MELHLEEKLSTIKVRHWITGNTSPDGCRHTTTTIHYHHQATKLHNSRPESRQMTMLINDIDLVASLASTGYGYEPEPEHP